MIGMLYCIVTQESKEWVKMKNSERVLQEERVYLQNVCFFFFQAEDGIRDIGVTGVQTCALPILHAVVGEEDGGLGAWATLRRGHRGDVCVIPEPTAGAVVTANAGALTFRLEVPGRAAHAAHRDQGVSAVEVFAEVHAGLRAFEAERQQDADPRFGGARFPYGISIGRVRAGDWASSVPDRLVAEGRYGVRLGEDVAEARTAFERRLAAICAADPWLAEHPVRLTWTGGAFASGSLPDGHPLLPAVPRAVADTGGRGPPGRADRQRVGQGKRVDIGGRRII